MWLVWSHSMQLENNLCLSNYCAYQNHCLCLAQVSKGKIILFFLFFPLWNLFCSQSEDSVALVKCKGHVFYNFRTSEAPPEAPQVLIYLWLPSLWAFLHCLWNKKRFCFPWLIFFPHHIFLHHFPLAYFSFVSYSHKQDPYESTLNDFQEDLYCSFVFPYHCWDEVICQR